MSIDNKSLNDLDNKSHALVEQHFKTVAKIIKENKFKATDALIQHISTVLIHETDKNAKLFLALINSGAEQEQDPQNPDLSERLNIH